MSGADRNHGYRDSIRVSGSSTHRNPDILLVYPPVMRKFAATDPPLGLMSIAATLMKSGASVGILDLNRLRWTDAEVLEFFRDNHFPVVGIGGMTTVYYYAKWLAGSIRTISPCTKIIAGGSFVTPCPEVVLSRTEIDAACIGEGEAVVSGLLDRLLTGRPLDDLKSVAFKEGLNVILTPRRERIQDLDILPLPAYELVDMPYYLGATGKRPSLLSMARKSGVPESEISSPFIMFTARGCPFHCTFCYRNHGNEVIRHGVDYLIRHIRFAHERFGVNNIAFYDETFNSARTWVMEFCRRVRIELPGFYFWAGGARADLLDEELVRTMRDLRFYEVSVGVESFDDRLLKHMGKGESAETIFEAIQLLLKYGMAPSYLGMIYGFPEDDEESLRTSEECLRKLGVAAYFQFPLPFPGTALYQQLKKEGRIGDEEEYILRMSDQMAQDLCINLSRFPDDQLVRMVREAEMRLSLPASFPEQVK